MTPVLLFAGRAGVGVLAPISQPVTGNHHHNVGQRGRGGAHGGWGEFGESWAWQGRVGVAGKGEVVGGFGGQGGVQVNNGPGGTTAGGGITGVHVIQGMVTRRHCVMLAYRPWKFNQRPLSRPVPLKCSTGGLKVFLFLKQLQLYVNMTQRGGGSGRMGVYMCLPPYAHCSVPLFLLCTALHQSLV